MTNKSNNNNNTFSLTLFLLNVLLLLSSPLTVNSQNNNGTNPEPQPEAVIEPQPDVPMPEANITETTVSPTVMATPAPTEPLPIWNGCVNSVNDTQELLLKGHPTTVCLILANAVDWSRNAMYLRLPYQPKADQFSKFHIPNSYRDLVLEGSTKVSDDTKKLTVHVASQQGVSFQKVYFDPQETGGKVFPHLTAVIDVKMGIVQGITWDDASIFCPERFVAENTYDFHGNLWNTSHAKQQTKACYIDEIDCDVLVSTPNRASTTNNGNSGNTGGNNNGNVAGNNNNGGNAAMTAAGLTTCDITLYVVWTGTDVKGDKLQSSNNRFSAFDVRQLKDKFKGRFEFTRPEFLGGGQDGKTDTNQQQN